MIWLSKIDTRGRSRAAASSKMECFVIIVNGFQPLTIITKRSILDVAAVLDLPLNTITKSLIFTLYGGDSKGFIMGFMALINKGWNTKAKFQQKKIYKNTEAETFILFNKSSKNTSWMWGENNAINCHICATWWVPASPLPPLFEG